MRTRHVAGLLCALSLIALPAAARPGSGAKAFAQLRSELPTPTEVRLASGAPGPKYWQQRADYEIDAELVDAEQPYIEGTVRIDYQNNSPHRLEYLWLQLDQNIFRRDSISWLARTAPGFQKFPYRALAYLLKMEGFEGGFDLKSVTLRGKPLAHTVVGTMMRIDLPEPLKPGRSVEFAIEWRHNVVDARVIWSRGGYEDLLDKDDKPTGERVFTVAQWYPRVAAYTDYEGWQNQQFIGRGEFTLELGDYDINLTVPADHVVSATGVLRNASKVLTAAQRDRLKQARTAKTPQFIITRDEAEAVMKRPKSTDKRTWRWQAKNVRDVAFASSRTFVWDAWGVKSGDGDKVVMAQSLYPPVATPLWYRYSTQAVAHTIEVYGRMTFPYPYPTAISVNGPIGGMEYPMICFNGPRADFDGTYYDRGGKTKSWRQSKYGLISVVIHEVGHNWFPMIVNSDERQWTWMDEGLNSFVQFVAEQEWEAKYPSWRGHPKKIVEYMQSSRRVPIMTNSESLEQFGNNAYGLPATALNILRETILGRENFDFAFKTYSNRWRFKRPEPADFFRTMEDASGVDLDWFWRGWFYGTDHVDIALTRVQEFELDTRNPDVEKPHQRKKRDEEYVSISRARTEALEKEKALEMRVNRFPELKDFYNSYDELDVTEKDREGFKKLLEGLNDEEKALLSTQRRFYVLDFENEGGVVMPVILRLTWADGKREVLRIPAQIWQRDAEAVSKLIVGTQALVKVEVDPFFETADADESNNQWPIEPKKTRFQLYKRSLTDSPMKAAKKAEEKKAEEAKKKAEEAKKKGAEKQGAERKGAEKQGAAPAKAAPTSAASKPAK